MAYSSRLELVVDSSAAENNMKRFQSRLKGVESAGDNTANSMESVGLEIDQMRSTVLRASGALTGGAAALGLVARQSSDAAREIKNLSRLAGADVVTFQKMTMASRAFGIEQEQLAQIMLDTQDRIGDFLQTGQGEFADFFEQIAGKSDLTAQALARMAGPEALQAIYNALEDANLSASETVFYMESLASDATRLIPLLKDNGAGFKEVADEAERLGAALSEIEIDQLTALRGEFADLEQIMSSSTSQIIAQYSGEITSTVNALGEGVRLLADNFDTLQDAATLAAGVMTARFVSAMAAGTASIAQKTAASIADARADAASAAAAVRRTAAEKQTALALLSTTRLEVQATKGTAAHTFALQQLSVARTRAATAAGAHTAAMNVATAATARASVAARGLSTALSLVGGPLGLLVGAGGLMYMFREELGLVRRAAEPTTQRIDNLTDAINRNSVAAVEAGIVNLAAEYFTLGQRAASATAEIERLTAAQENDRQGAQARLQNRMRLRDLREDLAQIVTEQEAAGNAANELRQILSGLGETVIETTDSTTDLNNTTGDTTTAASGASKEVTTLADSYESLLDRITPNRREARQYARDLGTLNLALATGRMTTTQYMQAMGMLQESFQAAQRETENTANASEDASQRIANSFLSWETVADNTLRRIDDSGQSLWLGLIDGSESALDTVKRGFQQTLAEIAHMLTTQKLTFEVAGMMGLDTTGMPGGGGGFNLNGISSLYNGAKKLPYVGDAIGGIGSALGFGASAAAPIGYASGFGAAAATGTYTGFAGSAAAGAAAAGGGGLMGAASAAMPWVGGALLVDNVLGLGIVDGIVGGISSLFGGRKTAPKFELATVGQDVDPTRHGLFENYGEGVYSRGALGTVGFYDPNTARLEETFDGFENAKAFLDGITALDNAMVGAVANLDNGAEKTQAMANAAQAVRLNAGDAAGIADQLATRTLAVVDVLDGDFSASLRGLGLDAEQITGRVVQAANAMQLLDSNSARLNLQFDASAAGAMRAADGMAQLMGGVGNLNASLSSFYDTFYTEEEKLQHLTEDLSGAFASMGRELPTTREGVRDVVESLELMGAAGQEQLATILQLNQPLAQYIAAMEEQRAAAIESGEAIDDNAESMRAQADIARERAGLEREWLRLIGDTEELRRRELAGIDESNRALQERIWAFKDEAAAQEAAQQRADLLSRTSLYSSGIVSSVEDALDAYNEQMQLASEVAQQREQQLRDEMDAVQQLGNLLDSLMLSNQSILDPAERLQEAQRQFAELQVRAEMGDTDAAGQLQGASSNYLDAAAAYYGQSSSQYADIFGDVTGSVRDLEDSFGESIATLGSIESIEKQILREEQRARDMLSSSLSEQVQQSSLLGSIADLIELLPDSLGSILAELLPEEAPASQVGGGIGGGFNEAAYLANKTAQVNSVGQGGRSNWTPEQVLDAINRDYGSIRAHYEQIGRSEGIQPFANGGAFTNGIVHRPTMFDMGLMGEAGAEAIMPLTNIGGQLGVRAELPMPDLSPLMKSGMGQQSAPTPAVNLEPLTRELSALRKEVAQLRAERRQDAAQAANQRTEQVREQRKGNRNSKRKGNRNSKLKGATV